MQSATRERRFLDRAPVSYTEAAFGNPELRSCSLSIGHRSKPRSDLNAVAFFYFRLPARCCHHSQGSHTMVIFSFVVRRSAGPTTRSWQPLGQPIIDTERIDYLVILTVPGVNLGVSERASLPSDDSRGERTCVTLRTQSEMAAEDSADAANEVSQMRLDEEIITESQDAPPRAPPPPTPHRSNSLCWGTPPPKVRTTCTTRRKVSNQRKVFVIM